MYCTGCSFYRIERLYLRRHRVTAKVIISAMKDTHFSTINMILTDVLIPWSRVLLRKLTVSQLVKTISAFCGTQMFITHNCPPPVSILSQLHLTHTSTPHFLMIHPHNSIPSTLGSPKWPVSFRFPHLFGVCNWIIFRRKHNRTWKYKLCKRNYFV
jgi:hypothetical protein